MPKRYWTIRLGRPDETDTVLRLVRAVYGEHSPESIRLYWQWRYLGDAPFCADILVAEHDGQVIGIQPVALFDYRWGDQRLKGAMYTGVLTHPSHRRRGVFRSLVNSANEHATSRGAHFSMTMPNATSLPGFRRFEGWEYPGLIPLYVKAIDGAAMLRPSVGRGAARLLEAIPRAMFRRKTACRPAISLDVDIVDRTPDDLDEVGEAFARECRSLHIVRSAAYWNWRYCAEPASQYRTLLARRGGQVLGAVVASVERRFKMDVGMILDVAASGGLDPIRALLCTAEEHFAARGLGLIACQATSPLLQQALGEEGYVCPPPRLLPKRFHYVYLRTGVAGMQRNPRSVSDWHLTLGDSDNV